MPTDLHMPLEHQRVLNVLRHCQGRDQAVSNEKLAAIAGVGVRHCRRIVKELVEQFGEHIGSAYGNHGGHYMIASDRERRETVDHLLRHGASTFRRAHRLDKAAAKRTLGQLEMELK